MLKSSLPTMKRSAKMPLPKVSFGFFERHPQNTTYSGKFFQPKPRQSSSSVTGSIPHGRVSFKTTRAPGLLINSQRLVSMKPLSNVLPIASPLNQLILHFTAVSSVSSRYPFWPEILESLWSTDNHFSEKSSKSIESPNIPWNIHKILNYMIGPRRYGQGENCRLVNGWGNGMGLPSYGWPSCSCFGSGCRAWHILTQTSRSPLSKTRQEGITLFHFVVVERATILSFQSFRLPFPLIWKLKSKSPLGGW